MFYSGGVHGYIYECSQYFNVYLGFNGFDPNKAKTATLAVLSGRFWSCFNTFLWYNSKSVRSFFLISRSSIPCRSLGRTKVFHICIVIAGNIPFLPCIPLPYKAYIVFLAVSIRFWVSGVLFSFLSTPRCIAWLTWDIFCPLAGLVPPLLVFCCFKFYNFTFTRVDDESVFTRRSMDSIC